MHGREASRCEDCVVEQFEDFLSREQPRPERRESGRAPGAGRIPTGTAGGKVGGRGVVGRTEEPEDGSDFAEEIGRIISAIPWIRIGFIFVIFATAHAAADSARSMLEDMQYAYDMEQPTPTRSSMAQVPVVGRVFQLGCDLGDVIAINSGFLAKYSSMVPWVVTAPVLLTTVPAVAGPVLKGITAAKTASMALAPLVR